MANYFDLLNQFKTGQLRVVDLRSPCEFVLGSMPHAVNVPLFTNEERAAVGTTFKQIGQNEAVQQGLEFVANKMEALLDELITLAGSEKQLAIYCWRGGMRSRSIAILLGSVGIKTVLLAGGYKAYRNQVLSNIDGLSKHKLLVLNGRTGSGKTELIRTLLKQGHPVIDFEDIACHRGSAVGDINIAKPQPTQQNFENQLSNDYQAIKTAKTIVVEIEQDLGIIRMPQNLRLHIAASDMVLVERSMEDRVSHLQSEYAQSWGTKEDAQFIERMKNLKKHIQGPIFTQILEHVERREFPEAIRLFLTHRYDKCYDKGIERQRPLIKETINISGGFQSTCQRVIELC